MEPSCLPGYHLVINFIKPIPLQAVPCLFLYTGAREVSIISLNKEGHLWTAVLEAAGVLGLERMLPRLVASKLPREPFLRIEASTSEAGRVKVLVSHACRHDCNLRPEQCITALLAEVEVQQTEGRHYQVRQITAAPKGRILVELESLGGLTPYAEPKGNDLAVH